MTKSSRVSRQEFEPRLRAYASTSAAALATGAVVAGTVASVSAQTVTLLHVESGASSASILHPLRGTSAGFTNAHPTFNLGHSIAGTLFLAQNNSAPRSRAAGFASLTFQGNVGIIGVGELSGTAIKFGRNQPIALNGAHSLTTGLLFGTSAVGMTGGHFPIGHHASGQFALGQNGSWDLSLATATARITAGCA